MGTLGYWHERENRLAKEGTHSYAHNAITFNTEIQEHICYRLEWE